MGRLANSWRLVKASASVLRSDRELIIFPIIAGIASLIILAVIAVPLGVSGFGERLNDDDNGAKALGIAVLFVVYLVLYSVVNYCNAALVGAALIRLRGGDPTAGDGFRIARQRLRPIIGYALIGATVGVILQLVRERFNAVGDLFAWLAEAAWGIVTYLVIPVLVVEDIGPVDAIKRSAGLLKRTWGEQVVGNFGIGAVFGLLTLAAVAVSGGLVLLAIAVDSVALIVVAIAIGAVLVIGLAVVASALKGIYTAALYRFAAEGTAGGGFDADLVQHAFGPKGS